MSAAPEDAVARRDAIVVASSAAAYPAIRTAIVDRFIQFNEWPTSRKTALLSGLVLIAHIVGSTAAHLGFHVSSNIDLPRLDRFLMVWCGFVAVYFLISVLVMRSGREGRWTAYGWVSIYSIFIAMLFHLFGTMSSPHVLWYPAAISLWALYFDERVGLFSAVFLFGLVVGVGVLELHDVLDYAPLLLNRTVDAQRNVGWFTAHVLVILVLLSLSFALQWLAIATRRIQGARLHDAHAMLDRSTRLIRRYVPVQIADGILSGRDHAPIQNERRQISIFFSDLAGFSEIAERLAPEHLARVINEYFSEMNAIAHRHGGTVDELSGDAILVLFGAPQATDDRDHALRAARMSLDMQSAVEVLNRDWAAAGIDVVFRVRMGINTGVVTIGHFGSTDRMKYTALGTHVNLAARLQSSCAPGGVLVSQATWELVGAEIECTPVGELQLKGISRPVMTYAIADTPALTVQARSGSSSNN